MERSEILAQIARNKKKLNLLIDSAIATRKEQKRVQMCSQAAIFASKNPCGIFNSKKLEDALCAIAASEKINLPKVFRARSVLHVLSRSYLSGGHSRVCERWILSSPLEEKHEIILLNQGDRPSPKLFETATAARGGRVIRLTEGSPMEKALRLRELASTFENVILHVHPDDVIPVLAFGTEDFKRPITLYNHADHIFWLGCSIADLVVNMRTSTASKNLEWRGIRQTAVLPLPILPVPPIKAEERLESRTNLNIPANVSVILSMASAYKYIPFDGIDFIQTALKILVAKPDTYFLLIGPNPTDPFWKEAHDRSNGRINPIGIVPHSMLRTYFCAADLCIGSFPLGSTMALLDTARFGIPCLALDTPGNEYDAFVAGGIECRDTDEIVARAVQTLSNPPDENRLLSILVAQSMPEGFANQLKKLTQRLPNQHQVHAVVQDARTEPSDFEVFIAHNFLLQNRLLKRRLQNYVRSFVRSYVRFAYPIGLSKAISRKLESYGIL